MVWNRAGRSRCYAPHAFTGEVKVMLMDIVIVTVYNTVAFMFVLTVWKGGKALWKKK